MLNNFIYAELKSLFEEALNNGEVLDEAIVFIEDTKEIWNHGTYFGGNKTDLSDLDTTNLATKEDLSNYLPLTGGTITGDLITTMTLEGNAIIGSDAYISLYWNNNNTAYIRFFDDFEIKDKNDNKLVSITYKGDGTKFLSDDGSYKTIEASGNSASAYAEVNHGTSDTTFTLTPNTFHVWDEVTSLDLSFAEEQVGVANEYLFQFTSSEGPTTLILPDTIQWINEVKIEPKKTHQVSVMNNIGIIACPSKVIINFSVVKTGVTSEYTCELGMTWGEWVNSVYVRDGWYSNQGYITSPDVYQINDVVADDLIESGRIYYT